MSLILLQHKRKKSKFSAEVEEIQVFFSKLFVAVISFCQLVKFFFLFPLIRHCHKRHSRSFLVDVLVSEKKKKYRNVSVSRVIILKI